MLFVGIDNGTSGTVSVIDENRVVLLHEDIPVKTEQSYTKKAQNITRVKTHVLYDYLYTVLGASSSLRSCSVLIERPVVNPMRFKTTVSAARCLEAVLITVERLQLPYSYIDSREWQSALLPEEFHYKVRHKSGKKHTPKEMKKAACDIARRLFPSITTDDADSLLIAEYARRQFVKG